MTAQVKKNKLLLFNIKKLDNVILFAAGMVFGIILLSSLMFFLLPRIVEKEIQSIIQEQGVEGLQAGKVNLGQKPTSQKIQDLTILPSGFNSGGFIADPGDKIILKIKNLDNRKHNLVIPELGIRTEVIQPGQEFRLEFVLPKPPQELQQEYVFFSDYNDSQNEAYYGKITMNF